MVGTTINTIASITLKNRPSITRNAALTQTPLFKVSFYFWLSFALLPLCRRHRIPFVLLTSGILYELGLFLVAPAIDYRYSQWMVLPTIVGTSMLLSGR